MTAISHTIVNDDKQPTIDESYAQMVKDGVIKEEGAPVGDPQAPAPEGEPKLILGKFKTQEDLEKSYQELEAKLSGKTPKDPPADPEAPAAAEVEGVVEKAGLDMDTLEAEFVEKGVLGEDSYKKLEAVGISKEMVDNYISGQQAQVVLYENSIKDLAGGSAKYDALITWAEANMSEDEIAEYDSAVNSFDTKKASFAVRSLEARMAVSAGSDPKVTLDGKTPAGTQAYESTAQMLADMNDPRYATDPAFRDKVAKRLAVSKI